MNMATASFITPDPLDGVDGTPVVANPYHYTSNDPLNKTDPLGLRPEDDLFNTGPVLGDVCSSPNPPIPCLPKPPGPQPSAGSAIFSPGDTGSDVLYAHEITNPHVRIYDYAGAGPTLIDRSAQESLCPGSAGIPGVEDNGQPWLLGIAFICSWARYRSDMYEFRKVAGLLEVRSMEIDLTHDSTRVEVGWLGPGNPIPFPDGPPGQDTSQSLGGSTFYWFMPHDMRNVRDMGAYGAVRLRVPKGDLLVCRDAAIFDVGHGWSCGKWKDVVPS